MIFLEGAALKEKSPAGIKYKNRECTVQPAFQMGFELVGRAVRHIVRVDENYVITHVGCGQNVRLL